MIIYDVLIIELLFSIANVSAAHFSLCSVSYLRSTNSTGLSVTTTSSMKQKYTVKHPRKKLQNHV